MDESAEEPNKCTPTLLPVETPLRPPLRNDHMEQDSRDHHVDMQSSPPSRFFEELFCASQTSKTPVPFAGALLTSSGPQSDVVMEGYLGKLDRNHRRYFALRAGSHTGPSRLEWYKSQEKFRAMESAGKAVLFGSSKQGVIYLRCCLGVSRIGSTRKGHTVAVYARDQTMVLVVEDQREQEEWYLAIKGLMEEEQKDEEHGEWVDEEDDGYCTLPPAAFFKEVWPVTVKPRGLGSSKSLAGESRLCLTALSLTLVRVSACSDLPSVTIPLLSVRRFGHLDGLFFWELGRSAPNGPGEIWMEAKDQGSPAVAQRIHEEVRDTVKALRALPDFSQSPTHNQPQTLLASKRCRPKYRDKLVSVRPLGSRLTLPTRNTEIQLSSTQLEHQKPEPESTLNITSQLSPMKCQQSSMSETTSYMEMKMDYLPTNKGQENDCCVAACGMEGWESGEEEEERLGYMMMSPQGSHSSSGLPQDDYVTLLSPHKHAWPADSSLQTSFNSSTSESCSSLHPHITSSHHQPLWRLTPVQQSETDAGQSQMSFSCSNQPQDDAGQEQKSAVQRQPLAQTRTTWSPVRTVNGSASMTSFATRRPGNPRPAQASPKSGTIQSSRHQAVSDQSVGRRRLSLCLPSCLQAEDRS